MWVVRCNNACCPPKTFLGCINWLDGHLQRAKKYCKEAYLMPKLEKFLFYLFIFLALIFSLVSCFRSSPPRQDNASDIQDPINTPRTTQSLVTTLLPVSYTTTSGSDEAQPVSNVHIKDQALFDNDYFRYC